MLRYSLNVAERTVALDWFMKQRITTKKSIATEKLVIIPPRSHHDAGHHVTGTRIDVTTRTK